MKHQLILYLSLLILVSLPITNAKPNSIVYGYHFVDVPEITTDISVAVNAAGIVFNFVRYPIGSDFEGAYIVYGEKERFERIPGAHVVGYYNKNDFLTLNNKIYEDEEKMYDVSVLLFPNANHKEIVEFATSLGLKIKEYKDTIDFDASGTGTLLSQLAKKIGVQYIDINEQMVPANQYTSSVQGGHYSQNNWQLYGANQIVAVSDSGLDNAVACSSQTTCTNLNPTLHPDLAGRIVGIYDIATAGSTTVADTSGHGTSTAGRVAGNGVANGTTNPTSHSYQNGPAAMAPEAKLYIQDVAADSGLLFGPTATTIIANQFTPAKNGGSRIQTIGYGSNVSTGGSYGITNQKYDQFSFSNKDYLFTLPAMNNGQLGLTSTITSPGTAKNSISVGAWDVPLGFMGIPGYGLGGIEAISGMGPTADGRIKPDVIAVGRTVTTRSSLSPYFGLPGPNGNYYTPFHDTSAATPSVAGAAALVREYLQRYENMTSPNASASMIKAVILNGAQDVGYGIPSNEAGWGAVSLADSLPNNGKHLYAWDYQSAITTGQIKTDTISVNAGQPLRVTLVWTDKEPASFSNPIPTLVNNLNLEVIDPLGVVYNGNDFSAPFNTATDSLNNVERVEITSPIAGNYQIRVIGASVPMPTQTFSVAVTADVNDLPVAFTALPQNVNRNNLNAFFVSVPYSAADPNAGDGPITMSWISKPSWVSGTPTPTGVFISATAPPTWGDYPVTLQTCNRRGQCAQATFHIVVNGDLTLTNTPPIVGTTMTWTLSSPTNPNKLYAFAVAFSNTTGFTLPDGRKLGIDIDDLTVLSLNYPSTIGMSPTIGPLNAAGQATVTLAISNIPIQGLTLHAGWAVIDPVSGAIPAVMLQSLPFTFQ